MLSRRRADLVGGSPCHVSDLVDRVLHTCQTRPGGVGEGRDAELHDSGICGELGTRISADFAYRHKHYRHRAVYAG